MSRCTRPPDTVAVGEVAGVNSLQAPLRLSRHSDTRLQVDCFRLALERTFDKKPR